MNRHRRFITLAAFTTLGTLAAALLSACDIPFTVMGFTEPKVTRAATAAPIDLPFREGPGGLVLLTASVASARGSVAAEFILDTGAPVAVIIDSPATRALAIDMSGARKLGAADNPAAPVGVIEPGLRVDFGGVTLSELTVVAIPQSSLACADRFAAVNFQGVIGADLFRNFVVEIDHARKRVRLHDPRTWQPAEGAVMPLTFRNRHIFVDAQLDRGDARLPVHLHVDTGKSSSLSLIAGSHPAIVMPAEGETRKDCYVHGTVETRRGAPLGIAFNNITARDVVPTIADSDRIGLGDRHGAIGIGLLRNYVTIFDYAGKRMVLQTRA